MNKIALQKMTRQLCHALYQGWENDPAIYMDMSRFCPFVYEECAVDAYFDRLQKGDRLVYAVMLADAPIGELQLKRIDRKNKECTLSIHLQNDTVKGKGYGTQAVRLGVEEALSQGLQTVLADAVQKNVRSQHVLEKVGFVLKGEDQNFRYYQCTCETLRREND